MKLVICEVGNNVNDEMLKAACYGITREKEILDRIHLTIDHQSLCFVMYNRDFVDVDDFKYFCSQVEGSPSIATIVGRLHRMSMTKGILTLIGLEPPNAYTLLEISDLIKELASS